MTNLQWLSVSLGVIVAVLFTGTLGLITLGLLVVLAGRWWQLAIFNSRVGQPVSGLRRSIEVVVVCAMPFGVGLTVAAAQFWSFEHTQVKRVDVKSVEGCIVERVVSRNGLSRFVFASKQQSLLGRPVLYRLVWRTSEPPREGDCWRLTVRLKPTRATRNEVGFDYERWLFARRISGLGSVKSAGNTLQSYHSRNAVFLTLRRHAFERLVAITEPYASGPLIVALGVGARETFSASDWDVLRRSGTAHLMAISGLHIGLAAMLGFGVGRYAPTFLSRGANLERRGAVTALLVAFFYACLAGFGVSTIRALVMLVLWYAWRMTGHSVSVVTTLLMTAAVLLMAYPWMVADTSFWLSAAAVGAIALCVYGQPPDRGWRSRLRLAVRIQLGVTLLMVPLALVVSNGVSWVAVPVNLILIPLFSLVIVPLVLALLTTLLLVPAFAHWPAGLLGRFLDIVWQLNGELASQDWAFTEVSSQTLWVTLPVTLLGLLILLPRGFPGRMLSPILVLPLFALRTPTVDDGLFRLDVLDVGQALAVVIQTQSSHLIYDTGNAWPGGNSADQTILPFLRSRRVTDLHTLIVSHADRDHAGGALALNARFPGAVLWAGESVHGLSGANPCVAGSTWSLDGVSFEFLHPPAPGAFEGNQQSCVLLIQGAHHSALLTGDLGGALERRLLPKLPERSIDIVIGAHHGSLSSSDERFVQSVRPRFVVFSNGYANQWGMPRPDIVNRWRSVGSTVLTTANVGQARFLSQKDGLFHLEYAARHPRPGRWRWRPSTR